MKTPSERLALWNALLKRGNDFARKLDGLSRGWLGIVWTATQRTLKADTSVMASAIAYFSLFSLFPLILLSISIASFRIGPAFTVDENIVVQELEFIAPALGQLLGNNIDQIVRARGSVSSVALISLIWSSSSVFYTLTHTLNNIWHIRQSRAAWKRRGMAILFVLAFVGPTLFLFSLAGSVLTNLRFWLPDLILPFTEWISTALTILLDITLFMAVFMALPHGKATWREILPGAIGAGLLWEAAKNIFIAFVATYISISNLVYGTVAAIIAFLFWAYIGSLVFIFGAYLSVAYWEQKQTASTA
ncbi:MAG: YihY/virulence factor BrkB family protein [Anaerolineales bacterium]|jgi:membrane protein|nr:YihY/virulence factor BrkB family protein [Anaerolineales bacterium]